MNYSTLATSEAINRTIAALKTRNIEAVLVPTKAAALEEVKRTLPTGAELMTGGSKTLEEIGLVELLKSHNHPWKNAKDIIFAEKDPQKQTELRRLSTISPYYLGSVHGIAETGELVFASATGSQLPAYAFGSPHVIWIAGVQKIVPTLEDAIKRVREYCLPAEDQHQKELGNTGSTIGKLLIFEREIMPHRQLTLILVNELVGV